MVWLVILFLVLAAFGLLDRATTRMAQAFRDAWERLK